MHSEDNTQRTTCPLLGLHCTACAARAEGILCALDGIQSARVSHSLEEVTLCYDPKRISLYDCQRAMSQAGYKLVLTEGTDEKARENTQSEALRRHKKLVYIALGLSFPTMLVSMICMHEDWARWLSWILTTGVLLYCGGGFYSRAYKQLTQGGLGMDTLVGISTGIAYIYSCINLFFPRLLQSLGLEPHLYFEAAAMIVAFVLLGKYLEQRASSSASETIKALMSLQPQEVRCISQDGSSQLRHIDQLQKGDRVLVRPSEPIPVDGLVLSGTSSADESMLTGETTPSCKDLGSIVYAGTKNLDGELIIESNTDHRGTRLAQIIELVKEAQSSKAPMQKLADRIAANFVVLIIAIASMTAIIWIAKFGSQALGQALISAITVLIVSCPCALGLATPMAIVVAVGAAARRGILIRHAESLEVAHGIEVIALDKTGTITEGKPRLTEQIWFTDEERAPLIDLLVEMERRSLHPHSLAILEIFSAEATPIELDEWVYHPGRGIEALKSGSRYLVGNRQLLEERGIDLSSAMLSLPTTLEQVAGESLIYFAQSNRLIALFGLSDKLKPGSKDAIQKLKAQGIRPYILTGDKASVAEDIAREVCIDDVKAECLPEEKVHKIKDMQRLYRVAMVGDGINDGAALAQSNLSIAMGQGSEVAIQAAMVTILSSDLGKLPELISLSRKTIRIMRQNLFWAFSYNLIAIPLATGLFAPSTGIQMTPMWASIAMSISSLLVVFNSLRLRYALSSETTHLHHRL